MRSGDGIFSPLQAVSQRVGGIIPLDTRPEGAFASTGLVKWFAKTVPEVRKRVNIVANGSGPYMTVARWQPSSGDSPHSPRAQMVFEGFREATDGLHVRSTGADRRRRAAGYEPRVGKCMRGWL